jgi:hypothetical protein
MEQDNNFFRLPTGVVSQVDVGRLLREIEALDEFLEQSAVRKPGTQVQMPRTSKLLDEMIQMNKLNVVNVAERTRLMNFLITLRAKAPIIHISFSADPAPLFTQKLITWLRENIHPLVLLKVGLQPNIGAGCVVRTTNKFFDLSLRQDFANKHDLLMAKIHGATQESLAK